MWLVGDAFNGWNESGNVQMTQNVNIFSYTAEVEANKYFAFFKDSEDWSQMRGPARGNDSAPLGDWEDTQAGGAWKITTAGIYTFEYNYKTDVARIVFDHEVVPPVAPAYYLIGEFNYWDQSTQIPFEVSNDVFTLTTTFRGNFKIRDENGNWFGSESETEIYRLTAENPSVTLSNGTNLYLENEAEYTLTIENGVLTVSGFPTEPEPAYYLVGDFNEWEVTSAEAFTEANGVFTLTKTFSGEFKIRDENGNWFGSESETEIYRLTTENPSVTLSIGTNLYLENEAEYTLTIENGVLTVSGFPTEPEPIELPVAATSIVMDREAAEMVEGETLTLTATVLPEDTTDKSVAWASDNEGVATVADGVVTAVAAGTATITATTADGSNLSAICMVTVNADEQPLAENRIEVENISVHSGDTFVLDLNMVNTDETLTALQFDMYLPEGLSIVNDEEYDEPLVELDEARLSRRDDHTVMVAKQNDGAIRVMTYSGTVKPFLGTDGALLHITLLADMELDDCELPIVFRDVTLTNTGEQEIVNDSMTCLVSVFKYYRGDMNGDDKVNVTDIVAIANRIMGNPSGSFIERNADLNGDNKVNVTDVVILANLVMGAGTSNAAPAPAPARAPMQSGSDESLLRFYLEDFDIEAGGTAEVSLMLETNIENLTAFEAYIDLPEGLEIFYDSEYEEYDAWVADDLKPRRDDHTVMVSSWEDGTMKMMCYSPSVKAFAAGEGAIVTMSIKASDSFAGTHEIALKNVLFTSADEQEYYLDDTTSTVTGPEMSDDGVTLADMLACGVDGGRYTVSDALAVAWANAEFAVVTDGNGNWLKVTGTDLSAYGGIEAGTLSGTLGGMAANPTLAVTAAPVDAIEVPYELTTYDMAASLAPKANELATVKGYYFVQNGQPVLRGYGRAPYGQSVTLDVTNVDVSNLIEGEQYVITAVVQLREAWSGAPRKVAAGGSDAYKNVSLIVTQVPGETTAITDLNADDDAPAQRYNLLGQPVDDNYRGIVIERNRKILVR